MTESPQRILIIVSAARSGSKFLRDLLGASRECAVIPYDINFVWRHGNEGTPDDALSPALAGVEQRTFIRHVVRRLAGIRRSGDDRLIVEKTVSNSLRVPFVAEVFPEARFVHLIRDGRAVAESTRRVWHQPPSGGYLLRKLCYFPVRNYRYGLWYLRNRLRASSGRDQQTNWGPRYPGMDKDLESMNLLSVCARQWSHSLQAASAAFLKLPRERVHEIRYEDLLDNADGISALCRFSGIADPAAVLAAWTTRVEAANRDKWRSSLAADERVELENLIGPQLRALGYA